MTDADLRAAARRGYLLIAEPTSQAVKVDYAARTLTFGLLVEPAERARQIAALLPLPDEEGRYRGA